MSAVFAVVNIVLLAAGLCSAAACSSEVRGPTRTHQLDATSPAVGGALQVRAVTDDDDDGWHGVTEIHGWEGITIRPDSLLLDTAQQLRSLSWPKGSDIFWPSVVSAPSERLRRTLERSLSLKEVFDFTPEEHREEFKRDPFLSVGTHYTIDVHREHLLQLKYFYRITGGSSRYGVRFRVVDVRTGERLAARTMFRPSMLTELARRIDDSMQTMIAEATGADTVNIDWRYVDDDGKRKRVTARDLDNIAIDDDGLTFMYEFTFPDIILREPFEYGMSWAELKPYIAVEGPLAVFVE